MEREQYVREYEIKKRVLETWGEQAREKGAEIKCIAAETHHRQGLVIKTFFYMKKAWQFREAVGKLQGLVRSKSYRSTFMQLLAAS